MTLNPDAAKEPSDEELKIQQTDYMQKRYATPIAKLELEKRIYESLNHFTWMGDSATNHGVILDNNTKASRAPESVIQEAVELAIKETERFVLQQLFSKINRVFQNVYYCPYLKRLTYPNSSDILPVPTWALCPCPGFDHMPLEDYIRLAKSKTWQDTALAAHNALTSIIAEKVGDNRASTVFKKNLSGRKIAEQFDDKFTFKDLDMNKVLNLTKGQFDNHVRLSSMV